MNPNRPRFRTDSASRIKDQHEIEIYEIQLNKLLHKFLVDVEPKPREDEGERPMFSANFRYCFFQGRGCISGLPLDLSSNAEVCVKALALPKIAPEGRTPRLGLNRWVDSWKQFNEHFGLVSLGKTDPAPNPRTDDDYDPFSFSLKLEVY